MQTEFLGYPPGPFRDDGIEASRAAQPVFSGGYGGKSSSYRRPVSECSIDKRHWRNLTVEEFHRDYYDAGKPVVLFGDGLVKVGNSLRST
jgi:hypothetical protein